ncbi:MAG TPA: hypothetical protein VGL81_15155 [Polyangiaceae bacterium]
MASGAVAREGATRPRRTARTTTSVLATVSASTMPAPNTFKETSIRARDPDMSTSRNIRCASSSATPRPPAIAACVAIPDTSAARGARDTARSATTAETASAVYP